MSTDVWQDAWDLVVERVAGKDVPPNSYDLAGLPARTRRKLHALEIISTLAFAGKLHITYPLAPDLAEALLELEQGLSAQRLPYLRSIPYREYLGSREWQLTRTAAKRRASFRCQVCNARGELHAHHRSYDRVGCERDDDITVLCRDCHALFHAAGTLRER